MKKRISSLIRNQSGQGVLAIVLILVILGALLIGPLLAYMGTGLKAGQMHESKMQALYAADSGVEDAINWLMRGNPTDGNWDWTWDGTTGTRTIGDDEDKVNDRTVDVHLEKITSQIYRITSIATSDVGGNTTVECYVQIVPGANLPIFDGALVSTGDITLGKECTVTGDILLNGTLNAPDLIHEEGEITYGGVVFPSQEENEAFAQKLAEEAKAGGIYIGNRTIPQETTVHIGPLYIDGDLIVQKECTVIFNGTVYVTGNIVMDHESTFSGSGNIIAEGDITLAKEQEYGTEGDSIIMSLYGNITFAKEVEMESSSLLVYAPCGTIEFAKECIITGSVVGANIVSGKEGSFTYIPGSGDWGQLPGAIQGQPQVKTYNINP